MFRKICLSVWLAAGAVRADDLSFDAALKLAEDRSPALAGRAASVAEARSAASVAGRMPNPRLLLGLENVPVSGVDSWSLGRDFMTMQKIGFMQEWPNSRKREAQVEAANAESERAESERRVQLLAIRRDTALAWLNRFYLERRESLFDELDRENKLFGDAVQAQLAGGQGAPADAVMPKQEADELLDRRDALHAEIAKSKAMLRRLVGGEGDQILSGKAPELAVDAEHLRAHVHEHAELQVFAPMAAMAQADLHEAEAMKRPDLDFELSYGRRGAMYDDMISAQVSIGLPLFSSTRIDPQISAKRHALTRIAAERDAMLRDHVQELESELADYAAISRQLERMQISRLPLAQQKVELQFASYRGNKGDLNSVIAARRELLEERLKLIDLEAQRSAIAAKLYFAYGEGAQ